MLSRFGRVALILAFFGMVLGSAVPAQALQIVLSGADFSGPTDNTGGNVTLDIVDIGVGDVQVTVTNNLVDPGAFVDELYLNTTAAPLTNPSAACVDCTATGGTLGTASFGSNDFKADGDGLFDILIELPNAPPDDRLTPGESIVFNILSDSAGFDANSFLTLSCSDCPTAGGNGPFLAAAHIQSLPNGGSDFIAGNVPEPGSLILLGSGLLAIGAAVRLRKR